MCSFEKQVMEVAAIAACDLDPVLGACIVKLTKDALARKNVVGVSAWQQCYIAVRGSWFCSAHSYDSVIQLADSVPHHDPSDECGHQPCWSFQLQGGAPQHDDFDHCAFTLTLHLHESCSWLTVRPISQWRL
jgi:hypothetical protein